MTEFFRNTLSWPAWAVVGSVPLAIIALYFLKLKRQPVEVPSTYLWTKVIEDLHVNSLWQRFRRSLLLFLQLLVALLAILALLRPGWLGQSLEGRQFIFLIDRSASMSTNDADGRTRLEAAKERVNELVDQMSSDMSAMVIAFDDGPDVVQQFTDNRRQLREAVARIQPTAKSTNIRGALELASGFANRNRVRIEEGGAEVDATAQEPVALYILSDGRFGPVEDFSLGNLQAQYLPVGSAASNNLAITTLSASRNPARPDERQAFVQVANFGDQPQKTVVELRLDGELVDAAETTPAAGDVAGVTFDLGAATTGKLEARLEALAEFHDALSIDDRGYAVVDPPRQAKILLVTPGNRALELGLSTGAVAKLAQVEKMSPDALAKPEVARQLQTEAYDLVIFDQCAPAKADEMPLANTLFIGRLPPLAGWRERSSAEVVAGPQIIDWQRGHPLLALVELGNVAVVDSFIVQPPLGGTVLVDSSLGPIVAIAPRDHYEDAVIGFEIVGRTPAGETTVNTNWPRMHSFPNFCLNVADYLAGASSASQLVHHPPGKPVELDVSARGKKISVALPDGQRRDLPAPESGQPTFQETDQLGVYTVQADDETVGRFAVNLFDRQESDVRLRTQASPATNIPEVQQLSIGYTDVAAAAAAPVRKELWTWLLLAALAVLTAEWYIYNRRIYI